MLTVTVMGHTVTQHLLLTVVKTTARTHCAYPWRMARLSWPMRLDYSNSQLMSEAPLLLRQTVATE